METERALHELGSPLTAVIGFAELLLKNWDKYTEEEKLRKLNKILDNGLEAQRLCKHIMPQEKVHCVDLDLGRVLPEMVDDLSCSYSSLEFTKHCRNDLCVRADPKVLAIILQHLVDNANRYRAPGTKILVSMDEESPLGILLPHSVGISVSNGGSHKRLTYKMMAPFEGDGSGESGLGLYIVKSYADQMGGTVSIHQYEGPTPYQTTTTITLWFETH